MSVIRKEKNDMFWNSLMKIKESARKGGGKHDNLNSKPASCSHSGQLDALMRRHKQDFSAAVLSALVILNN